jgi:23S rRNA (cytidine2498-2'-O)-methyltransferase
VTLLPRNDFLMVVCQRGAEQAIKRLQLGDDSHYRLAFSRPGLITFKAPPVPLWGRATPDLPLARTTAEGWGSCRGEQAQTLVQQVLAAAEGVAWDHLHIFQRDSHLPGQAGFEPGCSMLADQIAGLFVEQLQSRGDRRAGRVNQLASPGARVLDVMLISPELWSVGAHWVDSPARGWPGGVPPLPPVSQVISRAYFKAAEAIWWSQLAIKAGEQAVEIGSSPGGACQFLLDQGLHVTGVDPAAMDPKLLEHPRFKHWRRRSPAVPRRWFRPFRWLLADANVAPAYTLDTVEAIVSYPGNTRLAGLLLTLKLSDWDAAERLPEYRQRVLQWGFRQVALRQLAFNRQEVCLAAWDRHPPEPPAAPPHPNRTHRRRRSQADRPPASPS